MNPAEFTSCLKKAAQQAFGPRNASVPAEREKVLQLKLTKKGTPSVAFRIVSSETQDGIKILITEMSDNQFRDLTERLQKNPELNKLAVDLTLHTITIPDATPKMAQPLINCIKDSKLVL
jgi:transcriptional antiterminator